MHKTPNSHTLNEEGKRKSPNCRTINHLQQQRNCVYVRALFDFCLFQWLWPFRDCNRTYSHGHTLII